MPDTQWRPTWKPGEVSEMEALAWRKVFDFIYAQAGQQGPAAKATEVPPNSSLITVPTVATQQYGTGTRLLVTLDRQGSWIITANVSLTITGDANQQFDILLLTGGTPLAKKGTGQLASNGTLMISQTWKVNVSVGSVQGIVFKVNPVTYNLQVVKAAGAGTSTMDPNHSSLTAVWSGS